MRKFSVFSFFIMLFVVLFYQQQTLSAQNPAFFKCDSVAITHEGFAPTDIVLKTINVQGIGGAPVAANWPVPMTSPRTSVAGQSFSKKNLGQIFGIAHNAVGDLFVSASSSYNSGGWGTAINTLTTITNTPAGSGSVYRINNSGIVEFAEMVNTGSGLGNLAYDQPHNILFVTNFHDGKIYAYNATTGALKFSFDPNFDGLSYTTADPKFIKLGQRPWGIAAYGTTTSNVRLYYGRWTEDMGRPQAGASNQIWSVLINVTGSNVSGAESLVWNIPSVSGNYSNPPSDIEISSDGLRMLVAERSMHSDENPSAHNARVLELSRTTISSNIWTAAPLTKFGIGASAGTNSTGGTDFGEFELLSLNAKRCNATVWAASDFINFVSGNYVYGLQVLAGTGGTVSTSKWIDNDNVLASYDKSQTGDVDYRRCMNCPPPPGNNCCQMYRPAPSDSICCKAGILRATELPNCGPVANVQYTITGGVIQSFTSNCTINNPGSYIGTSSGTVTFVGVCNLANLWANLTATSSTGNITVTWVVTFTSGVKCSLTSTVKNCPHPLIDCDKFAFKQCVCTPAALSYVDIHITNQALPNSPICKVKIVKYDPSNNVQTSYWSAGVVVTPLGTPFVSPFNMIPSSGPALNVLTGNVVNAQLYFPSGTFTGSITVTTYHCNGDSCVKSWRPSIWPHTDPTLVNAADVVNVKPQFSPIFATGFQIKQSAKSGAIPAIKYISVSVADQSEAQVVAVTGAELYPNRTAPPSRELGRVQNAAQAAKNAMWEFKEPLNMQPGDVSGVLHVIFANKVPKLMTYTLYNEEGSIINNATIEILNFTAVTADDRSSDVATTAPTERFMMLSGAPNPAKDYFYLLYNLSIEQDLTFNIFDMNGRKMESIKVGKQNEGNHELTIETSHLPTGVYIIRMNAASGKISEPLKMVVSN